MYIIHFIRQHLSNFEIHSTMENRSHRHFQFGQLRIYRSLSLFRTKSNAKVIADDRHIDEHTSIHGPKLLCNPTKNELFYKGFAIPEIADIWSDHNTSDSIYKLQFSVGKCVLQRLITQYVVLFIILRSFCFIIYQFLWWQKSSLTARQNKLALLASVGARDY